MSVGLFSGARGAGPGPPCAGCAPPHARPASSRAQGWLGAPRWRWEKPGPAATGGGGASVCFAVPQGSTHSPFPILCAFPGTLTPSRGLPRPLRGAVPACVAGRPRPRHPRPTGLLPAGTARGHSRARAPRPRRPSLPPLRSQVSSRPGEGPSVGCHLVLSPGRHLWRVPSAAFHVRGAPRPHSQPPRRSPALPLCLNCVCSSGLHLLCMDGLVLPLPSGLDAGVREVVLELRSSPFILLLI